MGLKISHILPFLCTYECACRLSLKHLCKIMSAISECVSCNFLARNRTKASVIAALVRCWSEGEIETHHASKLVSLAPKSQQKEVNCSARFVNHNWGVQRIRCASHLPFETCDFGAEEMRGSILADYSPLPLLSSPFFICLILRSISKHPRQSRLNKPYMNWSQCITHRLRCFTPR